MDKFWKADETRVWEKNLTCIYVGNNRIGCHASFNSEGWEPCTREEFTAAAMQAIEKLKAQGIDIGTEWLPKWEPKPNTIVWSWDDEDDEPWIDRYVGLTDNAKNPYETRRYHHVKNIAPFTGEIPEPFKSRWEAEGNADQ
jgi:hypothetical protein